MSWREALQRKILARLSRVMVASDPDGLLLDEQLLVALREADIMVLTYDDPIRFRLIYEEDFRGVWDRGAVTAHLLVRSANFDLQHMPYDITERNEPLYLTLDQLFAQYDSRVLRELDLRTYDALWMAGHNGPGPRMSEEETSRTIVRILYAVDPFLVHSSDDLAALITRVHQGPWALTPRLAQWMAAVASHQVDVSWDLEDFLLSPCHWQEHLRQELSGETRPWIWQVRYWLHTLGAETHVERDAVVLSAPTVEHVGDLLNRMHTVGMDWLETAYDVATVYLASYFNDASAIAQISNVDAAFHTWVLQDYGLLQSLPALPQPKMVHHIPAWMGHTRHTEEKWVLLVMDGLSLPEWVYIRQFLALDRYHLHEQAAFAWVPSLTSISRQAIFSGRIPREFLGSPYSTQGEAKAWQMFWQDQHEAQYQIGYHKTVDQMLPNEFLEWVDQHDFHLVGAVANMADNLAHANQMGEKQILMDLRHWIQETEWLPRIIEGLMDRGYHLVLTSDHGHTPAIGVGKPQNGKLGETKGERAEIFESATLRQIGNPQETWGIDWPWTAGLPAGMFPVLARPHEAFVAKNSHVVSHGSIGWEELVVPVVMIEP
jgi:hypothetical protein